MEIYFSLVWLLFINDMHVLTTERGQRPWQRGGQMHKALVVIAPLYVAGWVAISRTRDYRYDARLMGCLPVHLTTFC